jgi:hypothetical protein
MAKKSAKKGASKKAANRKSAHKKVSKKAAPKKAIAKKAAPERDGWDVECSVQGTIATGLTRAAAEKLSVAHQKETGHPTTYTHGQ